MTDTSTGDFGTEPMGGSDGDGTGGTGVASDETGMAVGAGSDEGALDDDSFVAEARDDDALDEVAVDDVAVDDMGEGAEGAAESPGSLE